MSTPKEKKILMEILEMYKNMPLLWDKTHADYKNKYRRTNANQILLDIYKKLDETANINTLTKKILNLRTNYNREVRKVKESQENAGDDNNEVYVPTVWYFDALSFLGDNASEYSSSKQTDPLKTEATSPSISDGEGSYQNSEPTSSPPMKKRKFTNPIVYKSTNDNSLEEERSFDKPPDMKSEEWEIIGKAIGLQLRGLDTKQLTIAQKLISDAIYYAKFGLLTQQAYINVGIAP